MIRYGSRGLEVQYAQERLNAHIGAGLIVDGIFGRLTRAATLEYQMSHGLARDAIIGPLTWASLDGPVVLGGAAGGGRGGAAGGVGSKILMYDTGFQIFSPPSGLTMAKVPAEVQAKQKSGDLGPTVSVSGVQAGTDAELFVWNVLLQRADKSNWGTELDTITQIGRAPAQGGAAPVGRVTIQVDGAGNAKAILVSDKPLPALTRFSDDASARAALVRDFGFKQVTDGSASWTLTELNKAYEALLRLPGDDRTALKDVELRRESTVLDDAGQALAGEFKFRQGLSGTTVTDERQLLIADLAFSTDTSSFIGGPGTAGPMSFETIVHEAGHAVEKKVLLDAQQAQNAATAVFNQRQADTNAAVSTVNAELSTANAKFSGYSSDQRKAAGPYFSAIGAATAAINSFANETSSSDHPPSEKRAADAIAARDKQRGALPTGHPATADFAALSKAQDDWFATAVKRAAAQSTMKAAAAATGAASATVGGKRISKRLKAFIDFVNQNKIPPLTAYARDNWPAKPQEFFAEAYSLWLNDPDYLASQAQALKAWFDQGQHRV
jgi:peptidoglycan hydrolase-like protein with peptidoglycan-binding domain